MKFKNEVVVGLVVVVGMIIIAVAAFWLSGKPFGQEEREVVAIFQQVGQLRGGNPVVYRGVAVGRVAGVELSSGGEGVLVTMEIRPDIELTSDAAVVLAPQSLFGDWQAQITNRGAFPELEYTTSNVPGILPGATLPDISELTAVAARIASDIETLSERVELAFTEETAIKIRETIENVQEVSEQLTGFVSQQTRTFDAVAQNALAASENIQQTTAAVERVAGGVEGDVEQILANARQASANLEQLSVQLQSATVGLPALVARADTTLVTVGRVASTVDTLIVGLQPQVAEIGPTIVEARQALATLQRAAARIEQGEGTLGRLLEDPALYEETQAAIASLRRLMADLQANPGRYIGQFKVF